MHIYIHNVWILDLNHISRVNPFPGHLTVCPRTSSKRFRRRSPWPSIPGIPPAKPCFGKKGKPPSPRTAPRKTVSRSFSRRRPFFVEERWGKTYESYPLNMDNYCIYIYIYGEYGNWPILWWDSVGNQGNQQWPRRSLDLGWESRKRCGFENGWFSWENDDSPVDGMGVPKFSDQKMIWREMPRCHCTLSCLLHFGLCARYNETLGNYMEL